jgi:flagellar hook-associated protein 2
MNNSIAPNTIFQQQNPYENIIQELMQVEGQKKRNLQSQEKTLETKKSAVTDVGSKLTSLHSMLSTFEDPLAHKLNPMSGKSSNKDAISVESTAGIENPGNYTIKVNQLAKNDIVLSDSMASDGSTLSASGNASFTMNIDGKSASIDVDTDHLSNHEVLNSIAAQVNDQFGDKLQASVFKLGDGNVQLSFKGLQAGKQSYISISNEQGDAAGLNLQNIFSEDSLDSKFTIDGVSFERSSNKVQDAVQGLTLKLKQVTDQPGKITVTNDTKSARKNVKDFIDKFNAVNSLIRQKTHLNGKTGEHGPLQDERVIRNLSYNLRSDASLPVASMAGKSIQSLFDIGIELNKDGKMHIEDSDKLDKALGNSPKLVKELFTSDDGLANKLQATIDGAVKGDQNIMDTIKSGIDRKVGRLDDRIADQTEYLKKKEQKLRSKFANLQQLKIQGQNQLNRLSNFQSFLGI